MDWNQARLNLIVFFLTMEKKFWRKEFEWPILLVQRDDGIQN